MFWLIISAAISAGIAWWIASSLREKDHVSKSPSEASTASQTAPVRTSQAPKTPSLTKPSPISPIPVPDKHRRTEPVKPVKQTPNPAARPAQVSSKPGPSNQDPPGELSEGNCWQLLISSLPLKYGGNPGTSKPREIVKFYIRKHCWKTRKGLQDALGFADRVCKTSGAQNRLIANLLLDMEKIDRNAYMNGVFDEVRAIRGRLMRLLPQALMDQRRGRSIEGYELQAKRIIENALKTYPPEIFYGLYAAGSHPDGAAMLDLLVQWLNKYSGWKYSKDEVAIKNWKATRLWTIPLKKWAESNYKKLPCVNR